MSMRNKLILLAGGASLCFLPIATPWQVGASLHAQSVDNPIIEDDDEEDEATEQDGDVTNDDMDEADPDDATEAQWSDAPETEDEREAEQVDADDYIAKCADKAECQETLNYVESQLNQLLTGYGSRSTRKRKELGPSRSRKIRGTTKYRVLPGQRLELIARKPGPNDRLLWSQVTRVVPRPQSDKLMGSFHVFRKRKDDTLAYVQGEPDSERFLMGINEPNHLGTDLREQYLTVVHEFMHMIVLNQFVGGDFYDQNETRRSRDLSSVGGILKSIFGLTSEEDEEEESTDEEEVANEAVTACSGVVDDGGCYPDGTLFNAFTRKFWTKDDLQNNGDEDFYAKNKSRFVTEYATSSPHEDMSESFSYWVIAEGKGKTVADAKQRFFGRYPQLVALKEHIRRTVIAEILKSQPKPTKS